MRIEHAQHGWWMHALRHAQVHDHHALAPADHAVRESVACEKRTIGETGSTGCAWCDATERLPERLSYPRYLERQNTEAALPAHRATQTDRDEGAADRSRPSLGDVPPPQRRTEVERRVETTYQVRIISPAGRYLDMWV